MATIKDIINSPLLLTLVCIGLLYITGYSVVPSLSIVIGLVALAYMITLPFVVLTYFDCMPTLGGSMTLGLFASTSAGIKVVKGGLKGIITVADKEESPAEK